MSEAKILTKLTMRTKFEDHLVNELPKPTKQQTDEVKADFKKGVRCTICGGWHHPKVVHLKYVGHAALTDRMLDVDPSWHWEPLALGSNGLPVLDSDGGMWIRLTICGITRLGYGDAQGKTGGDAMKERIGDALRNAAMRFGAALDLWHKGDLHGDGVADEEKQEAVELITQDQVTVLSDLIKEVKADTEAYKTHLGVASLSAITAASYPKALAALERKRAQQPAEV